MIKSSDMQLHGSLFYRYFHGHCSSDLRSCVPPLLRRPRYTRLSVTSHPFSVEIPLTRVNQYNHSFFPFTGRLWNSLPSDLFPPAYDLDSFKKGVSRHFP